FISSTVRVLPFRLRATCKLFRHARHSDYPAVSYEAPLEALAADGSTLARCASRGGPTYHLHLGEIRAGAMYGLRATPLFAECNLRCWLSSQLNHRSDVGRTGAGPTLEGHGDRRRWLARRWRQRELRRYPCQR